MSPIVSRNRVSIAAGTTIAGLLTAVHATGFLHGGGEKIGPWTIPLISAGTGFVTGMLLNRKRDIWTFCLILGTIIGLYSAFELYNGPAMELEYQVGLLTNGVFITLGFVVGAFGELVFALHRLTHAMTEFKPKATASAAPQNTKLKA